MSGVSKQIKLAIFERDGWTCHYCGIKLTYRTATVDHKLARSKGGGNGKANLLTSCAPCNIAKGDQSYEDFVGLPRERPDPRLARKQTPEREEWGRITADRMRWRGRGER